MLSRRSFLKSTLGAGLIGAGLYWATQVSVSGFGV